MPNFIFWIIGRNVNDNDRILLVLKNKIIHLIEFESVRHCLGTEERVSERPCEKKVFLMS